LAGVAALCSANGKTTSPDSMTAARWNVLLMVSSPALVQIFSLLGIYQPTLP
jgi:hypothetical protein